MNLGSKRPATRHENGANQRRLIAGWLAGFKRKPMKTNKANQVSVGGITVTFRTHPGFKPAPFDMCFTRGALEEFVRTVGKLPPESGAKGFGPKDQMGFDVIEFDEPGSRAAGSAIYRPDVNWGESRCKFHVNQPDSELRLWSGDLHSHPGGYAEPSPKSGKGLGDLGYVEEVFNRNETMEYFHMPIATGTGPDSNEVEISPWVVQRGRNGSPPQLFIAEGRVCEVSDFPKRVLEPEFEARVASARQAKEMAELPKRAVVEPGDLKAVPASALIPEDERADLFRAFTGRLQGILSAQFHDKTILVVGVGAGSISVEKLARLTPKCLRLVDRDHVEIANLSRTAFTYEDAIRKHSKVDALARRIREINPLVKVEAHRRSLTQMSERELKRLLRGVDLIVAGTDNFEAQALCNILSERFDIPSIYIGIHAGADGGRIVWHVPGFTPCYRCVARERYRAAEKADAGLNLHAAPGSVVDCQFIDTIALKISLAILERGQPSKMGVFFDKLNYRNDIIVRCDPAYEWGGMMWDAVLGDLPVTPKDFRRELKESVAFAMDPLWLRGERDPLCPVCGDGTITEKSS